MRLFFTVGLVGIPLLLAACAGRTALVEYPVTVEGPPSHSSWRLSFSDEFNVDGLDEEKWESANQAYIGHILSSRWRENLEVKDGVLRLLTKKEARAGQDWTTGHMWSRVFRQEYGYWEARYKYGSASGLNNAFWTITKRREDSPYHFEIDINEGHHPNEVAMTLHDWKDEHWATTKRWHADGMDLSEDFHVYGFEWTPTELVWYFDGQEIRRISHEICHREAPVFFSTAVTEGAGTVTDVLDGTSMDVDWVRVYERIPSAPIPVSSIVRKSEIGYTSVMLEWDEARDDATAQSDLVYRVYQSQRPDIAMVALTERNGRLVAEVRGKGGVMIENLRHSCSYYLNVVVADAAEDKTAYGMISLMTPTSLDNTPPVVSGSPELLSANTDSLTVKWNAAVDEKTREKGIVYRVYVDPARPEGKMEPDMILRGETEGTIGGLKSSTDYRILVTATDASGNASAYGNLEARTDLDLSPAIVHLSFDDPEDAVCDEAGAHVVLRQGGERVKDAERGWVFELNGKDDYLSIRDLDVKPEGATIMAWIKSDGAQTSYTGIVFNRQRVVGLTYGMDQDLIYRWPGGANWDWPSGLQIPEGVWSLVAMTIEPERGVVYLMQDGKWGEAVFEPALHEPQKISYLDVGRDEFETAESGPRYLKGRLDDVRIYDRALTREELSAILR